MRLRALMSVVLVGASAIAPCFAQEEPEAAAPKPPAIKVTGGKLETSREVRFSADGKIQQATAECSVLVNFDMPANARYISHSVVTIETARTDTGEDLAPPTPVKVGLTFTRTSTRDSFFVRVPLAYPRKGGGKVSRLSGSVKMVYVDAETKTAEIGDIPTDEVKSVEITGLGSPLSLGIARGADQVLLIYSPEDAARLAEVRLTPAPTEKTHRPRRLPKRGDKLVSAYPAKDFPADGRVTVTIYGDPKVADVPFLLENIPMLPPEILKDGDAPARIEATTP